MNPPLKLLLVEDNPADIRLVREMLHEANSGGYDLQQTDRLKPALSRLREETFDEVLLDLGLPDSQGMQTLSRMQEANSRVPIIVLTNRDDEGFAAQAVRAGAQDYLIKGRFTPEALAQTVRYAIERKHAEERIRQLNADLERRVTERTAELATANRELESFAYSVSHDLRAPLRAIDGFSRILLRDSAAQLDATAQANLERIRSASQRMGDLIDDLLKLSRTTRADLHRIPVDLGSIARRIADELQRAEPERQVTWQIAESLTAVGDPILLGAALENLLRNAWKFTSRTANAQISFTATEIEGERVFCVRDNGVGFDMAFSNRLFGAFQRLHSADEFPGTGIGLATVQRIIHRHGGRIWAQAAVDLGASFYFTLGTPATSS